MDRKTIVSLYDTADDALFKFEVIIRNLISTIMI